MEDRELLAAYAERGEEEAFRTLVRRHGDWVYSVCVRRLGDSGMAEDAAQAVFVALAQQARRLAATKADGHLTGWLHEAARFGCANLRRGQARRRRHESEAAAMNKEAMEEVAAWDHMKEEVEPALDQLSAHEREAILLRFYRHLSYAEMGQALAVSQEAAKKRLHRALERLREVLAKRGIIAPAIMIGTALLSYAVQPAPSAVAAKLAAVHGAGVVSVKSLNLAKGVLRMMRFKKIKLVAWISGAVTAAATLVLVPAMLAQNVPPKNLSATASTTPATTQSATMRSGDTSPLDAIRAINKALEERDPQAFGARMYARGADATVLRADLQSAILSLGKLKKTLETKFGKQAAAMFPLPFFSTLSEEELRKAQVKVAGDTATVMIPDFPDEPPMLIKDGNIWKMNLDAMTEGIKHEDLLHLHANMRAMIALDDAIRRDVENGKLATLDAVSARFKDAATIAATKPASPQSQPAAPAFAH